MSIDENAPAPGGARLLSMNLDLGKLKTFLEGYSFHNVSDEELMLTLTKILETQMFGLVAAEMRSLRSDPVRYRASLRAS